MMDWNYSDQIVCMWISLDLSVVIRFQESTLASLLGEDTTAKYYSVLEYEVQPYSSTLIPK